MKFRYKVILILLISCLAMSLMYAFVGQNIYTDAISNLVPPAKSDSALLFPIKERNVENVNELNKKYPIDLKDPSNISTTVEYDTKTGNYMVKTKAGELDLVTPLILSPQEYNEYSLKQDLSNYWIAKNTEKTKSNENKFSVTDMKFNIGPADKIFGPGGVQIRTQGSAELIFGFKRNFINNPALPERARKSNVPNFDQKINMSVTGRVGDKVNFTMNYDTDAGFDFDKKLLKLSFKGKEDDIIKLVDAGNVSLPLNTSLISGSSALFGIRTDLQFGKLSISTILSQQESESKTVSTQGGVQKTPFEVKADQYDENQHFFLSQFFRDNYEKAVAKLPFVSSGITINRVEVWVTNKRGHFDEARNIVAFMDLAEPNKIDNNHWQKSGTALPTNSANSLYSEIKAIEGIRDVQQTNSILANKYSTMQINGGEDYEKIESAQRLNPSEYTVNNALGFISLKKSLNSDEVLAVAYEYSYNGQVYQVGEFSTDNIKAPNALILKLLKSTTQSPHLATWNLMMKNIYSTGAYQMQQDGFELNIVYRNDSVGTEVPYITEGKIANRLLLRVLNLDRLDSRNATNPDGKFDYIEGYTALSSAGKIIFPVLEPFGSFLKKQIGNNDIAKRYTYQELYDSTLIVAREFSEKNKFTLKGSYKGSAGGSEISLNAMNVPRGSVKVTAGGTQLIENVDYTVNYMMGTVTILNQSILESNTNVDVKLENQNMFNMQRKSLLGTHLEYTFNKDFSLGATVMHLSEMPLTKKVNTGNEPIKNTIFGFNTAWKKESQWITNVVDKIPFVNATQPSSISFNAEYAQLIPGHSKVISSAGLAYIDDFEATQTNIDIHYPYNWKLASTPYNPSGLFPEANLSNNIDYGKNRALLAWYSVDQILNGESRRTPSNLRGNVESQSNHYTRQVRETELFPNRDVDPTRSSFLSLLNLSYYPTQRGPYNLDTEHINSNGTLQNPEKRWGGIMRKLDISDFETSNIEYFEFWIMDPFIYDKDQNNGGDLYFNFGDISEDILKDGKKAFEHGLPIDNNLTNVETTVWGRVPKTQSTVSAFDNTPGARAKQDVGLDGLSTDDEFLFPTYKNYVENLLKKLDPNTVAAMREDPNSPLNDPAGDNYRFYLNDEYDKKNSSILERYKYYNGTEGNSPDASQTGSEYSESATLRPDMEDINSDNTLNEYEKYFQYKVSIRPQDMQIGRNHINDIVESEVALKNGKTERVKWYQFKIPMSEYNDKVGSIRNFKSIRFMRMFLTNFSKETHIRFATMDLVRGEWKLYKKPIATSNNISNGKIDLFAVNVEENSRKKPVNYIMPPGITRETDPQQAQLLQQNEQAMVLRVSNLGKGDARAVYKNTTYDMRQYKRLQMFVHAEAMVNDAARAQNLQNSELTCFLRIGSDMVNNYYEYEIPLSLTPEGVYTSDKLSDREIVWPKDNMFDLPLTVFTKAKLQRNTERVNSGNGLGMLKPFVIYDKEKPKNKITVVGNPSLSNVENIMIGVRNSSGEVKSGEIWVNELRMSEFDEAGGWAGLANLALNLSDLGSLNLSGRMETAGFGGIESNVNSRKMEDTYQINLSAALDLGRFLPEKAKLQIPAYFTYTTENHSPKYNPLDEDIILKDAIKVLDSKQKVDSLKNRTQMETTTKSFNVTNAKLNLKSKKPMFYDPANLSFTYSVNESDSHTPEIEQTLNKQQKASIAYSYSFNFKGWEPFKESKTLNKPAFKIIKDFNINPLPTSISYNTSMDRNYSHVKLRDLIGGNRAPDLSESLTFSKNFLWNRQFDMQYNLTKSIKFGIQTAMNANIEESYYTPEIGKEYYEAWRDTVWNSIKKMGTPYTYQQTFNASWKVPINKLPLMDWASADVQYNSTYSWNRSNPMEGNIDIGNVASSMGRWSGNARLDFERLYKKSKFLKEVIARGNNRNRRPFTPKTFVKDYELKKGDTIVVTHSLNSEKVRLIAKTDNNKIVPLRFKVRDAASLMVFPDKNIKNIVFHITTEDPNARTFMQQLSDYAIRLPLSIRQITLTYNQSSSLTLPGFLPEPGFMGLKTVAGKKAPGIGYVFGFHNNKTLEEIRENNWLYMGSDIVNPANEAYTSDLDIRATIEPLPGLKIDLSATRQQQSNSTIHYMFEGMPANFSGNFSITQIALSTAFQKIGNAENNYRTAAFDQLLANRQAVATRLESMYRGTKYPTTGFFSEIPNYAGKEFNSANGTFNLNSPDVLIPAFIAAYTGRNIDNVKTNPFLSILDILPNWRLNFNGLSKIKWIKEHFKSVSLSHSYSNRYTIGNYSSFSTWVPMPGQTTLGYIRNVQDNAPMPSLPYDISTVSINETFSPLIGVNLTMKNSLSLKTEYKKQRNLSLNLASTQLMEALSDEFVIGMGYVVNNFDVVLKLKSNKKQTIKNDLKLNLDFSYKDIKSLLRKINENITQASSGNKVVTLRFTADYVFSSKVNFQLFFDKQLTAPLVSTAYPVSATNMGLSFKFMLSR